MLTKTENGFIKRLPADTYNVQHRGGRGITGMTTREDDTVENMFVCSTHDYIMLFSNLGRMYRIKAYEIPEGSRTSKGMNIINILPLMPDEKINIILPASELHLNNSRCLYIVKPEALRQRLLAFGYCLA